MTVSFLGTVTSGAIKINNADWGNSGEWKDKYENAIANLLSGQESEFALTAL